MIKHLLPVLAIGLAVTGCSWFGKEETPVAVDKSKRIDVLPATASLNPDPAAAREPVSLPDAVKNTAWPLAGGYPDRQPQHPELAYPLQTVWKKSIGRIDDDHVAVFPTPVVLDNQLATLDGRGKVSLFKIDTSEKIWETNTLQKHEDAPPVPGGVAHAGNRIIVTSGLNSVVALDAKDGKQVWRTALPAPVRTAPTLANGRVYVVTVDNELQALDLETGNLLWNHQGLAELTTLAGGAAPAASGNLVLAAYSSGELFGLLADNGRPLWFDSLNSSNRPFAVASLGDIAAKPVIDNDTVFAVGHNGTFAAINARTGQRLWSKDIGGVQPPWVSGNSLFILNNENALIALTRDGRVRWVKQLARFEDPKDQDDPVQWYGPVLAGGQLLLAGSNGQMQVVDPANGKTTATVKLPDGARTAPVVANGMAFVVTDDAEVVGLR